MDYGGLDPDVRIEIFFDFDFNFAQLILDFDRNHFLDIAALQDHQAFAVEGGFQADYSRFTDFITGLVRLYLDQLGIVGIPHINMAAIGGKILLAALGRLLRGEADAIIAVVCRVQGHISHAVFEGDGLRLDGFVFCREVCLVVTVIAAHVIIPGATLDLNFRFGQVGGLAIGRYGGHADLDSAFRVAFFQFQAQADVRGINRHAPATVDGTSPHFKDLAIKAQPDRMIELRELSRIEFKPRLALGVSLAGKNKALVHVRVGMRKSITGPLGKSGGAAQIHLEFRLAIRGRPTEHLLRQQVHGVFPVLALHPIRIRYIHGQLDAIRHKFLELKTVGAHIFPAAGNAEADRVISRGIDFFRRHIGASGSPVRKMNDPLQ